MRTAPDKPSRPAFTLIEMVVVIGIILVLMVIGAAFLPGIQGNQKVQTGVDRLSQWLLIAKQRAKHDGLPTGLRFILTNNPTADPPPPNGNQYLTVNQFFYVQQPDYMFGDPSAPAPITCFTQSVPSSPPGGPPTFPAQFQVLFNNNPDFTGGDASNPLVQAGDYLELFGGGAPYQITGTTIVPFGTPPQNFAALNLSNQFPGVSIPNLTANWRIIRQPRRVAGEDVLTLPQDVVVDLSVMPIPQSPAPVPNPTASWAQPWSQNVPARAGSFEILFSPSGAVIGQTASSGKVLLWVRDATVPSPSQADAPTIQGNPSLVSIQVRTGFIGSYPVVPNTASALYPSQFYTAALQGRSGF
jgi:prepilin-type N-terminal cleavage/methylation domain-containing protein